MKRFTDTEIWGKEWFQQLPSGNKLLWRFLCDRCDMAGVWDTNWTLASFQIGTPVEEKDIIPFGNRTRRLDNGDIFLVQFIAFQWGELNPQKSKVHLGVLRCLESHGLSYPIDTLLKARPLSSRYPIDRVQGKEKEKEQEKEKGNPGGMGGIDCGKYTAAVKAVIACRPEFARLQPDAIAKELIDAESNPRRDTNLAEFCRDVANMIEAPRSPIGYLRKFLASTGRPGTPQAPQPLSPAEEDYAQEAATCIRMKGGRDIGRLWAKIDDTLGREATARVKARARELTK